MPRRGQLGEVKASAEVSKWNKVSEIEPDCG
jgi:hypothetical protein